MSSLASYTPLFPFYLLQTISPHSNQVNIAPNKVLEFTNDHDDLEFALTDINAMAFIWGQQPYVPAASRLLSDWENLSNSCAQA